MKSLLCLAFVFALSEAMPHRNFGNLKETKTEVSLEVDPSLFLAFLEATDPQLALKALPKILGGENIHLIRRHAKEVIKTHFDHSHDEIHENTEHVSDQDEDGKKSIFRLY